MIEALIAAAILLIIALGLIPLFSRAITDNSNGNDATQATNGGRTQLEDLLGVPFANTKLAVVGTQTLTSDSFAMGDPAQTGDAKEGWWPGTPSDKGTVLWTRATRVRQYSVSDLTTPLAGDTAANFVQLKEVEVVMTNPKQGILGSGQGITLRILKPF
jgi:Tfp pilus assembly protein PilV